MNDLISRQKAIMDAESWVAVDEYEKHLQKSVIEWLKEFPPAELDTDTISRQAAIDVLNEYFTRIGRLKKRGLTEGEKAISLDTVGVIKALPSAQLERKKGKWTPQKCGGLCCSECGGYALDISDGNSINIIVPSNYCPHCGASMKNRHSIIVKDLDQKGKNND